MQATVHPNQIEHAFELIAQYVSIQDVKARFQQSFGVSFEAPAKISSYLSVDEVAERLNIKPSTVRTYCKDGRLSGVKAGHVWRIKESAVESFGSKKVVAPVATNPIYFPQKDYGF